MKPKTEMRVLGIMMVLFAIMFLLSLVMSIPIYIKFSIMSWDRIFRTECMYENFMVAYRSIFFGVFPGLALFFLCIAWDIFKFPKLIPDENNVT